MAKKPEVIIETQGGPLTENDFEGEAPMIGSADARYSTHAELLFDDISNRVAAAIAAEKVQRS